MLFEAPADESTFHVENYVHIRRFRFVATPAVSNPIHWKSELNESSATWRTCCHMQAALQNPPGGMNFEQWLWLRDTDFRSHGPHCRKSSSMNKAANVGRAWANKGIVQTTSIGDVHSKPVHTIRNRSSTRKIT